MKTSPQKGKRVNFTAQVVCPSSELHTWDVIAEHHFGADVANIQQCLEFLETDYSIDWNRLCLCGFSDGATYALSLGLLNADVFSHIIALSPGFVANGPRHGSPDIFICHGRNDKVLPIDACSRKIVPKLRSMSYEVIYKEFGGPHVVRPDMLRAALKWFIDDSPRKRSNAS